ncbi:MAG: methyltransferase domain-containing protein [Deltaproteobacteria bacterium]|nr:methyltransferase domain-containing protein [Deltaproteobacteria bacterium]
MNDKLIEKLYSTKENGYYSFVRWDVISSLKRKYRNVLDIGCGDGSTLQELKKLQLAECVVGLDLICKEPRVAFSHPDEFLVGNIENIELPYEDGYFDLIICADVIEHLIDPWNVLKNLHRLLGEGGNIVASFPNVSYRKILRNLIFRNDFEYVESGILDRGHLRFFTIKTALKMIRESGYKNVEVVPIYGKTKDKILSKVLPKRFCCGQFILVGEK